MLFWTLPNNKHLAFIPRTGSTAWGQAILDTFYPQERKKQNHAITPDRELAGPQYFVPHSKDPQEGELLGVMRNPIERFRSGFSRAARGKTVDQYLNEIENGARLINIHVRPASVQFSRKLDQIKWYLYERDLNQLATDIGLEGIPDISNDSDVSDKPDLTEEQISRLRTYYAADFEIYDQL